MGEHPIHNLMKISMENIKQMVDVDTIVGNPVNTESGDTIIPISKVAFDSQQEVVNLNPLRIQILIKILHLVEVVVEEFQLRLLPF